jgi:ubiquinone/menaquinone biosynthesis C-methylase UbiE
MIMQPVQKHYTRENMFENVVEKFKELGVTDLTRKDISGIDEFHVRGAAVSMELAKDISLDKNTRVLDVGCGLGGPARMLAAEFGSKVTGLDLTPEFIRSAKLLSELVGLGELTTFVQGDALNLPFADNSFDVVWTQHVQMNIENKEKFYSEITRVLAPGGTFIYYDIFSKNGEALLFPVPWADNESLSSLISTKKINELLEKEGLEKIKTKDQTPEAIQFFAEMLNKPPTAGPKKPGLDMVMGKATPEKLGNLLKNIKDDKLELQSGVYRKNQ